MKHCIFDFDGVLVDSMDVWAGIYVKLLKDGTGSVPDDMVKAITPLGNAGAAKYCIEHGLSMSLEEVLKYTLDRFICEYSVSVKLKSNVAEALVRLKESGYALHVLTASSHCYVDQCLKNNGIYDLFGNVWSTDDFGLTKAQPLIYKNAASLLGASVSDCMFFDDNYIALSTAKEAGMIAIGVYDRSSDELVEDMKSIADKYIYDFSEIIL